MVTSMKQRENRSKDTCVVLDNETDDEAYKRYKQRCYGYLAFKALQALYLGLLLSFLIEKVG